MVAYDRGGGFELSLDFHTGLQQAVGTHFGSSSSSSSYTTSFTTSDAVDISTTTVTIEPVNEAVTVTVTPAVVVEEHPIIHCMSHSQGTLWSIAALYPNAFDDDLPSSDATSTTTTTTTTTSTTTTTTTTTTTGTATSITAATATATATADRAVVEENDDKQGITRRAALYQQPIVRGSDDVSDIFLVLLR